MPLVTTYDIAKASGVSQSTVSRALRGDERIRSEVRAKVVKMAEELGYRRDPVLSALSLKRWAGQHSEKQ